MADSTTAGAARRIQQTVGTILNPLGGGPVTRAAPTPSAPSSRPPGGRTNKRVSMASRGNNRMTIRRYLARGR